MESVITRFILVILYYCNNQNFRPTAAQISRCCRKYYNTGTTIHESWLSFVAVMHKLVMQHDCCCVVAGRETLYSFCRERKPCQVEHGLSCLLPPILTAEIIKLASTLLLLNVKQKTSYGNPRHRKDTATDPLSVHSKNTHMKNAQMCCSI